MRTLRDEVVLITGGTGSWGRCATRRLLTMSDGPARVIVFADSEASHAVMRSDPDFADPRLEYFLGNIRDLDRLRWAFRPATVICHAGALKEVPSCEYNLFEAVKTNVLGTQNVVEAAISCRVPRVFLLSTDKACAAYTSYGKTKAIAEDLFIRGNSLAGSGPTRFSVGRWGNIRGSRASVEPAWLAAVERGEPIKITDERMSRYWWTLDQAVEFVFRCLGRMVGGECWVPKLQSSSLGALADAVVPVGWPREIIGVRTREKLHEYLVSEDEAPNTVELDDAYVILPAHPSWPFRAPEGSRPVAPGFSYSSNNV
jgi:UDP-N-acetylglucosamine 4,6-dehydratase/5-epimerase